MNEERLVRIPLKIESARVQREVVAAEATDIDGTFIVRNIPAFAYGVAYGDLIKLVDEASGEFQVVQHSGQVTIRIFVSGTLEKSKIKALVDSVVSLGGMYEVGKASSDPMQKSLMLISLNISVGLDVIAKLLAPLKIDGSQWEYGNIFDDNGLKYNWCIKK